MRDDALLAFLKNAGTDWNIISQMLMKNQITETKYMGHKFYLRKFKMYHK